MLVDDDRVAVLTSESLTSVATPSGVKCSARRRRRCARWVLEAISWARCRLRLAMRSIRGRLTRDLRSCDHLGSRHRRHEGGRRMVETTARIAATPPRSAAPIVRARSSRPTTPATTRRAGCGTRSTIGGRRSSPGRRAPRRSPRRSASPASTTSRSPSGPAATARPGSVARTAASSSTCPRCAASRRIRGPGPPGRTAARSSASSTSPRRRTASSARSASSATPASPG